MTTPIRDIVPVALPDRAYDIVLGAGAMEEAAPRMATLFRGRRVLIIQDENVARPHGEALAAMLANAGFRAEAVTLPAGETTKSVEHLTACWDVLAGGRYGRDAIVIALGGGVIGDLVGFVAASYMRGVDFVQVPTSLLAMVDSSVGGKTGINHPVAKNLIGAFWQPRLVLADTAVLQTLPESERISALAEIIKYGVIFDAGFFRWLEHHIEAVRGLDDEALRHAVRRSCEIKAHVVLADERENGLRKILNFGHTLGHAFENSAGYGVLRHGEAIAIGMVEESAMAMRLGLGTWCAADHDRVVALIARAGLPTRLPATLELTVETLLDAARADKKNRDGIIRYALPVRMGTVEDHGAPEAEAEIAFRNAGARG